VKLIPRIDLQALVSKQVSSNAYFSFIHLFVVPYLVPA
jgi:hypothetical protein